MAPFGWQLITIKHLSTQWSMFDIMNYKVLVPIEGEEIPIQRRGKSIEKSTLQLKNTVDYKCRSRRPGSVNTKKIIKDVRIVNTMEIS